MENLLFGTKVLEEQESIINGKIRVVKDLAWGTHIQAEGLTQSGGVVEDIWRSTLRTINHRQSTINNCLILGLGGGTAAKLVRKFWPEAKITGVDIDPVMVEMGKKYLDLDKIGVDIKISDAAQYTKYKIPDTKYDLILVDLYKGYEYPKKFESEVFLKAISKLLSDKGIAVFNRLYVGNARPRVMGFGKKLEGIFSKIEYFHPEANLMFICQ